MLCLIRNSVTISHCFSILSPDLEAVPGSAPLGEQKKNPNLKPNPYVPEGDSTSGKQSGQCLCVPQGKCANPTPSVPLPPPGSGPLPPPPIPGHHLPPALGHNTLPPVNTDGAGLIDVRIVNRVSRNLVFLSWKSKH